MFIGVLPLTGADAQLQVVRNAFGSGAEWTARGEAVCGRPAAPDPAVPICRIFTSGPPARLAARTHHGGPCSPPQRPLRPVAVRGERPPRQCLATRDGRLDDMADMANGSERESAGAGPVCSGG